MSANLLKKDANNPKALRIVAGKVSVSAGTPSVSLGGGFTVTDTAAGKVTINFSNPGKYLISCVANPIEDTAATGYSCKIMGTPSGSAVIVATYVADGTDGALADNISFYFNAVLQD